MSKSQLYLSVPLGISVGFVIAWSMRGEQLLDCRATLRAAELTQAGTEHMMEACLDQSEQLEVCELGQRAADKVLAELETDLTIAEAQIVVLRKKCASPDEDGA